MSVLTRKRAKPAVPFAGKYRIIDFTLSNCVNSGVFDVLILTQYRPHSLNEHIGKGRPWDLDRSFSGGVHRKLMGWRNGSDFIVSRFVDFRDLTAAITGIRNPKSQRKLRARNPFAFDVDDLAG